MFPDFKGMEKIVMFGLHCLTLLPSLLIVLVTLIIGSVAGPGWWMFTTFGFAALLAFVLYWIFWR